VRVHWRASWRAVDQVPNAPMLNGLHSEDGHWWWDGQAWLPAHSIDGSRWWNGVGWAQAAPKSGSLRALRRETPWFKLILASWVIILVAWIPMAFHTSSHPATPLLTDLAIVVGALAGAATIGLGSLLGYRRTWRYLGWAGLGGSFFIAMVVFFTFEGSQPANAPDGPGVGIAAFLFAIAISLVAAMLLLSGGFLGALIRRSSRALRNWVANPSR
jgi:hypothetical protein